MTSEATNRDTLERDEQQLRFYGGQLREAEAALADLDASVSELRQIVAGFESRVGRMRAKLDGTRPTTASPDGDSERPEVKPRTGLLDDRPGSVQNRAPRRQSLTHLLREIMKDGKSRDVDAVVADLADRGYIASGRSERRTVTNRLYDLMEAGYLARIGRGTYQLKLEPGSADDATRPEQLVADDGINRTV